MIDQEAGAGGEKKRHKQRGRKHRGEGRRRVGEKPDKLL
jgi:hypothetical protein